MKEITMYETFDGEVFETREEAEAHERAHTAYKCWNWDGKHVNDVDAAIFVMLNTDWDADAFIEECKKECAAYEGIESGDLGLFMWDEGTDTYRYIGSFKTLMGFTKVLNEIYGDDLPF